jgi:hypothetical protein
MYRLRGGEKERRKENRLIEGHRWADRGIDMWMGRYIVEQIN